MNRFSKKTAIVTGGSSGIGRAIAIRLAKEGANVVIADRDEKPRMEGRPTHEEIISSGGSAIFVHVDVSDEGSVERLFWEAGRTFDTIHILVNNAGIYEPGEATQTTIEDWNRTIAVNLTGTFLCAKHALRHMHEKQAAGRIVNIASIAGLVGFAGSAAYCASKGGVVELTRQLAADHGKDGITVNCVAPGVIKTAMTQGLLGDETTKQAFEANTIVPRLGEPEDIAAAVAYLASEEASFVTGAILPVDGGWTDR